MFKNIDHAICISLKQREDRRARLESEWKKVGLTVEYLLVNKDEEDPQRGCFHSHQRCAAIALERGYKNILIFEDDVVFEERIAPRVIARVDRFIAQQNPDILYLGVILGKMWLTWHRNISRCRAVGAHAYVLSRQACKLLMNHKFTGLGIDTLYKRTFKAYCAFPMLCSQLPEEVNKSDIDAFRDTVVKDQHFWNENRRRQYKEIVRNFPKTLLNK